MCCFVVAVAAAALSYRWQNRGLWWECLDSALTPIAGEGERHANRETYFFLFAETTFK